MINLDCRSPCIIIMVYNLHLLAFGIQTKSSKLKGLAMVFAGQENQLITSKSKEIYIYFNQINKIPTNLLKLWRKTVFLVSFILEAL